MKKISSLNNELAELMIECHRAEKKEQKKIKRRMAFLKMCIMYLESEPDVNFIKSEIKRIEKRIEKISDGFDFWNLQPRDFVIKGEPINFYYKEMGVPKLKKSLTALRFLLKA